MRAAAASGVSRHVVWRHTTCGAMKARRMGGGGGTLTLLLQGGGAPTGCCDSALSGSGEAAICCCKLQMDDYGSKLVPV